MLPPALPNVGFLLLKFHALVIELVQQALEHLHHAARLEFVGVRLRSMGVAGFVQQGGGRLLLLLLREERVDARHGILWKVFQAPHCQELHQ